MAQRAKPRAKSAAVMADVHLLNIKEEQDLCDRLNKMDLGHYITMSTLREVTSQAEKQCRNFLTQRTMRQRTTLEHVMTEIRALKEAKRSNITPNHGTLFQAEVFPGVGNASPRLRPARSAQHSLYWDTSQGQVSGPFTPSQQYPTLRRAVTAGARSTFKLEAATNRSQEASRKTRAVSSRLRGKDSTADTMTFRKLGGIATIESISLKEAEKKKQAMIAEREKMNQLLDEDLQKRINEFLKKFEKQRYHSYPILNQWHPNRDSFAFYQESKGYPRINI